MTAPGTPPREPSSPVGAAFHRDMALARRRPGGGRRGAFYKSRAQGRSASTLASAASACGLEAAGNLPGVAGLLGRNPHRKCARHAVFLATMYGVHTFKSPHSFSNTSTPAAAPSLVLDLQGDLSASRTGPRNFLRTRVRDILFSARNKFFFSLHAA